MSEYGINSEQDYLDLLKQKRRLNLDKQFYKGPITKATKTIGTINGISGNMSN
jgi:hypothetical protein